MGEGKSGPVTPLWLRQSCWCALKKALCLLCEEWVVMEQKWKKWKQRVYSGSTAGVQVRGDGTACPWRNRGRDWLAAEGALELELEVTANGLDLRQKGTDRC